MAIARRTRLFLRPWYCYEVPPLRFQRLLVLKDDIHDPSSVSTRFRRPLVREPSNAEVAHLRCGEGRGAGTVGEERNPVSRDVGEQRRRHDGNFVDCLVHRITRSPRPGHPPRLPRYRRTAVGSPFLSARPCFPCVGASRSWELEGTYRRVPHREVPDERAKS